MSVDKETYLIYRIKFGEEFTNNYWKQDFYEEREWDKSKLKDKPYFISDGMSGEYTFFGFITQLSNGEYEEEVKEIDLDFSYVIVARELCQLYPNLKVSKEDIRLYYLPHYT